MKKLFIAIILLAIIIVLWLVIAKDSNNNISADDVKEWKIYEEDDYGTITGYGSINSYTLNLPSSWVYESTRDVDLLSKFLCSDADCSNEPGVENIIGLNPYLPVWTNADAPAVKITVFYIYDASPDELERRITTYFGNNIKWEELIDVNSGFYVVADETPRKGIYEITTESGIKKNGEIIIRPDRYHVTVVEGLTNDSSGGMTVDGSIIQKIAGEFKVNSLSGL